MTISIIRINSDKPVVRVISPYNGAFVSAAHDLGGKWDSGLKCWDFDARDEERVRDLCRAVYGDDGVQRDTCTLRVEWINIGCADQDAIVVHGRPIARAVGRDSGAKLADGVVLLAGRFGSSGSRKNWTTVVAAGTVVLVRDFPRAEAERRVTEQPQKNRRYSIERGEALHETAHAAVSGNQRTQLEHERERLTARLAEIEAELAALPAAE